MATIRIGEETWELHGASAKRGRSAAAMPPGAKLPATWRVFGPWQPDVGRDSAQADDPQSIHKAVAVRHDPAIDAWAQQIAAIPEEVTIAGVERPGRDVAMVDNTLDLDNLFGGHDQAGCQAIAIAELALDGEGELAIGCGTDWWMQWWVDGKTIFDTLATGNNKSPVNADNHVIRLPLKAGRHLLAVRLISGGIGRWLFCARLIDPVDAMRREALSSPDWEFLTDAGEVYPPAAATDPTLAIRTDTSWRDFTAEFDFRWDSSWTDAGFVFRARDPQHYYLVHVPVVGQHARAEHFWGFVSKVDERGYAEVLKMEMLHGVSSLVGLWHHVKVAVQGDTIHVWVDGRPMSPVVDETYCESGYVGLSAYDACGGPTYDGASSSFRNLRISGTPAPAPPYAAEPAPVRNWFQVTDIHGSGCGSIGRAANGDLLTSAKGRKRLRSRDNGRTWSVEGDLPSGEGSLWPLPDGRLAMIRLSAKPPFTLSRSVSDDNSVTWSPSDDVGAVAFPPELKWRGLYACCLLKSRAGALCLFAHAVAATEGQPARPDHAGPDSAGYCIRSVDDGESWSDPVNIDGGYPLGCPGQIPKECSEISAAQTADGGIVALVRPYRSPVMWESWSFDDGVTWQPMTRGPFPMYACNRSMTSTRNGALVIGGRFLGMGVQVSHDGGMTWQGYAIDNACWSNGAMFEVEPNVVLFIYGGKFAPLELRGQLIRVTDDGIEPVRR